MTVQPMIRLLLQRTLRAFASVISINPTGGRVPPAMLELQMQKAIILNFLDADDMLHPEHLAGQLAVLHHESCAHVSCNW
jgi:hypothetical protein